MDNEEQGNVANGKEAVSTDPRSLMAADRGIRTGGDFASLMSHLISDIISGRVTPQVGNAACNAGGKLLKIVEMQYKFGTQGGTPGDRVLMLVPKETPAP